VQVFALVLIFTLTSGLCWWRRTGNLTLCVTQDLIITMTLIGHPFRTDRGFAIRFCLIDLLLGIKQTMNQFFSP